MACSLELKAHFKAAHQDEFSATGLELAHNIVFWRNKRYNLATKRMFSSLGYGMRGIRITLSLPPLSFQGLFDASTRTS